MSDQTELLHLLRQKTTDATYPITLVEKNSEKHSRLLNSSMIE